MWAGVDVGGHRKSFHLGVLDVAGRIGGATRRKTAAAADAWLRPFAPELVAVDTPRSLAAAVVARAQARAAVGC